MLHGSCVWTHVGVRGAERSTLTPVSDTLYRVAMSKKRRIRPRLNITVDPAIHARLLELQKLLPGSSLSGIIGELLEVSLPVMEGMLEALRETLHEDGTVDEARARDAIAQWAGAQLLGLHEPLGVAHAKRVQPEEEK